MKDIKEYQVVIGYHTHEQTKKLYPVYGTKESPVPVREVHPSLEIGRSNMQISGLQMFVGNNCSYDDYLKIIEYAAKNPINKKVFESAREKLKEEMQDA